MAQLRAWLTSTLFVEAESISPEHDSPVTVAESAERVALLDCLALQLGGLAGDCRY